MARRHYPQLDGLRGVAISAVLVGHVMEWGFGSHSAWWRGLAECGVLLFFVLSGFLITDILIREEGERGKVDLRAFYIRRALRLLPALFFYVGTVAVLKSMGLIRHESWGSVGASLLYVRNIFGRGAALGHLWSLSLEEQFYLTWPIIFLVTRRWRMKAVVTILAGMAVWRAAAIALHLTNVVDGHVYQCPWFRYDSILYGCFVALCLAVRPDLWHPARWRWLLRPEIALGVVIAATALEPESAAYSMRLTLQSLGMTWLLWYAVTCRAPEVGYKLLASRPLAWLGKISYSLYLWQGMFVELPSPAFDEPAWALFRTFPLNIGMAFLMALVSYRFVEQPFLRLKHRFAA